MPHLARRGRSQKHENLTVRTMLSRDLLPPPVTPSDEEPIAAGGRQTQRMKHTGTRME
jgi:hypothetical protein